MLNPKYHAETLFDDEDDIILPGLIKIRAIETHLMLTQLISLFFLCIDWAVEMT